MRHCVNEVKCVLFAFLLTFNQWWIRISGMHSKKIDWMFCNLAKKKGGLFPSKKRCPDKIICLFVCQLLSLCSNELHTPIFSGLALLVFLIGLRVNTVCFGLACAIRSLDSVASSQDLKINKNVALEFKIKSSVDFCR